MEREPCSAVSAGQVPERRPGGMPVLQVNVLHGLVNEDGVGSTAGSLASTITASSSLSGHSTTHRANAAAAGGTYPASGMASTTRRLGDNGFSQFSHSSGNAATGTAVNGAGTTTSTLAKPVLDLSQVRCTPLDQWLPDAHVVNCMAPDCSNSFSLFNRKHHCRMCGRVFCSSCCNNIVSISAAVLHNTSNGASTEGLVGTLAAAATSSATTPEPQPYAGNGGGDGGASAVNNARRAQDFAAGAGPAASPNSGGGGGGSYLASPAVTGEGNGSLGNYATAAAPSFAAVPCRVCASCSYEVQLVISTRQENGEPRRRSRGELKMIQRVLLVNIMTYLNLRDLATVALVSADFYFMSRDNLIWYQYNMTRWAQERDTPQLSSLKSRAAALRAQQQRGGGGLGGGGGGSSGTGGGGGGARGSALADDIFKSASVIQDATALSESEAAKRVISLHARYNYTQFLDFARRQEMARCEGLSSFSLGARILLASPIRVAIVGPCGIGKTASVHAFLGEKLSQMVVRPTIGFERRAVTVRLARGLSTEVVLHLYDLSGANRYEELRRFVCRHCHVIGLCYDPAQKVTLVQAADIMMELEPALGPQPVVVCGLVRQPHHHGSGGSDGGGGGAGAPHRHLHRAPLSDVVASSAVGGGRSAANGAATLPAGAAAPDLTLATPLREVDPVSRESSAATTLAMDTDGSVGDGGNPLHCDTDPASSASQPPQRADTMRGTALTTPTTPVAVQQSSPYTAPGVSVDDAVGITVRGHSSIQCPLLQPTAFFEAVVQSVLDRLAEATVANTTTISEISAELTMQGAGSPPPSTSTRNVNASGGITSVPASAMRGSVMRRRPRASRAMVQQLLNLTMQPCALDVLLDRK